MNYYLFFLSGLGSNTFLDTLTLPFSSISVTLISEGAINLVDAELNELLLSYKSMHNDKLKIVICENCKEYDY